MSAKPLGPIARSEEHEAARREAEAQRALGDLFPHLKRASLQAAQAPQGRFEAPARLADTRARFLLG